MITLPSFRRLFRRPKFDYMRFRRGRPFLISLFLFCMVWFAFKFIGVIIDPDNGWLNLLLSFEASIAGTIILDLMLKQADGDRATLARIEAHLKTEAPELDEILRILKK